MNALLTEAARNSWVMLHEYGHHMQQETSFGDPDGVIETSVDLYALAVGRKHPHEYTDKFPGRWADTQVFLKRPRAEKTYGADGSDPQAIFEQLRLGLGEEFLRTWHKLVRVRQEDTTDTYQRKRWFVVSASIAAQRDPTDFFADWGLLKESEQDIWAAVRELHLPRPAAALTALRPYTTSAPTSALTTTTPTVAKGTPFTLRYSTPADTLSAQNWIGLYPAGIHPGQQESIAWKYTPDASGTITLATTAPGPYVAWYLHNDGYAALAGPLTLTVT